MLTLPKTSNTKSDSRNELEQLEDKTAKMIESLYGISDVSVMISPKTDTKRNTYLTSNVASDTLSSGIDGVAVICKGGGDSENQSRIINFISSLYGVPSNRIFVGE